MLLYNFTIYNYTIRCLVGMSYWLAAGIAAVQVADTAVEQVADTAAEQVADTAAA